MSIKVFLSDVDGVLTDGGMYYTESGDEFKKFKCYDGMGMKLLQQRGYKVGILTLGQYLRPTLNHLPVERWVTPQKFNKYREIGLKKGFLEVVSGPMVRSSYRAEKALEKNNAGLDMTGT